jgi:hypothetical protein
VLHDVQDRGPMDEPQDLAEPEAIEPEENDSFEPGDDDAEMITRIRPVRAPAKPKARRRAGGSRRGGRGGRGPRMQGRGRKQ